MKANRSNFNSFGGSHKFFVSLENAAVRFYGEAKYTDKTGKVTFDAPEVDSLDESKRFKLTVPKEGFSDHSKYVNVYFAMPL